MASVEEINGDADLKSNSFAQRAQALFDTLAEEEAVNTDAAGLVVALARLDLHVTEDQVVKAAWGDSSAQ